uniref:Uncharacterized protein n=1 Tax=viral metagenome TaxID=1070528 RepID=A0A6C0LW72_9ZZZZ
MSNSRYIEIDSQFRNRTEHPSAANFMVPISISGRKGSVDAVDPVSTSTPETVWVPDSFNTQGGSDRIGLSSSLIVNGATPLGGSSTNTVIFLKSSPGHMQIAKDYYTAAVIRTIAAPIQKARIVSSIYMGTSSTADSMRIVISGTFVVASGDSVEILNPTDITSLTDPWMFIPSGKLAPNAYVNTVIYNQTRNEYRPAIDYQSFTHLIKLDTSGLSSNNSGPLSGLWTTADTYSLRPKPVSFHSPLDLSVVTLLPAQPNTKNSFNLNPSVQPTNFVGSFLEVEQFKTPATDAISAAGSITQFNLDLTSSIINDFYTGGVIRLYNGPAAGQFQTITNYDGGTKLVTVYPGFSAAPNAGNVYQIIIPQESRRIIKYTDYRDSALAPLSTTTILFTSFASDIDGFYNGLYITDTFLNETRIISTYVVAKDITGNIISRTATVATAFTAPVTTFTITSGIVSSNFSYTLFNQSANILFFSYDNLNPFVYSGSLVSQQQMVCYEIELLNLVLPNAELAVGAGGQVSYYPYVYVELKNISSSGGGLKNIIYSNNPHSTNMLFRAAIDDVPNPVNSSFIKIDGDGATQTIKFKPNDNLQFSVRLQNGEIFKTVLPEFFSPSQPNPLAQISAYFSIRRI